MPKHLQWELSSDFFVYKKKSLHRPSRTQAQAQSHSRIGLSRHLLEVQLPTTKWTFLKASVMNYHVSLQRGRALAHTHAARAMLTATCLAGILVTIPYAKGLRGLPTFSLGCTSSSSSAHRWLDSKTLISSIGCNRTNQEMALLW